MGFLKKMKDGMDQSVAAQQFAQQHATQAAGQGQIGVQGMPVDPAAFGGPSTKPLAADDPMLQPINGVGLADYAAVAKECQARGMNDEAGMRQISAEMGFDADVFGSAMTEWVDRMGKSMVVGQEFRRQLGY